jgi:hypothetical protein
VIGPTEAATAFTCAVAVGDAFDGLSFYGPFEDAEAAGEWAELAARNATWNVVVLQPVTK